MYRQKTVDGVTYKVWDSIEDNCDQDEMGHCLCASDKQDATDNSLSTVDKTVVGAINETQDEVTALQENAQSKSSNDLTTVAKTIIGAINELNTNKATETELNAVREIAQGRTKGYAFDTTAELDAWLADATNTAQLSVGDVLLIRDISVPDAWWDGTTKQILETQQTTLDPITNSEIDELFVIPA
ncbi:MAG: hypothetical protein EOL95_09860 [Bacteroidia bacterium]|nr:hypothetical protein [Bacteroidia bacterium]